MDGRVDVFTKHCRLLRRFYKKTVSNTIVVTMTSFTMSIASLFLKKTLSVRSQAVVSTTLYRLFTSQQDTNQGNVDDHQAYSHPSSQSSPGAGSHKQPQHLLSWQVLKSIKEDLTAADVNNDGCIDFEELKLLLRKYQEKVQWTDDDIESIGDLFFVGSGGRNIKHTTFLRGLQYAATQAPPETNPLGLKSLPDDRCWTAQPTAANDPAFHKIQETWDEELRKYVEQLKKVESTSSSSSSSSYSGASTNEPQ